MRKPIALFDLDGSLADYDTAMKDALTAMASPGEVDFMNSKLPHIEERGQWVRRASGFWSGLKPIVAGVAIFDLARECGYENHILTKGPQDKPHAWAEKLEWVREHLSHGARVPVHMTADKSIVNGQVLYDDWPEYCLAWLEFRPRGYVIMPERPYNQDFKHPQVLKYTGYNTADVKELFLFVKASHDRGR